MTDTTSNPIPKPAPNKPPVRINSPSIVRPQTSVGPQALPKPPANLTPTAIRATKPIKSRSA